jgi:cytoskeletal protein RodZ
MAQELKYCTRCGATLQLGKRFCGQCGAPVPGETAGSLSPERPDWQAEREASRVQSTLPAMVPIQPKPGRKKGSLVALWVVLAVILVGGAIASYVYWPRAIPSLVSPTPTSLPSPTSSPSPSPSIPVPSHSSSSTPSIPSSPTASLHPTLTPTQAPTPSSSHTPTPSIIPSASPNPSASPAANLNILLSEDFSNPNLRTGWPGAIPIKTSITFVSMSIHNN